MENVKEITKKVEGKVWKDALEKAYQNISKKVKIDGFRPGKAPRDMIIKKYTKEALNLDAADVCLQQAYIDMMEENKDLEIVAQPEVSLKSISDEGVEFNFKLTLKPTVKLGKYENLKVKKEKVTVTKEEIDHEIEHLRSHYAENIVKEGKLENGDIAVIDFEGFKDGVAFDGGKGENYPLTIGSNSFIPGFEEQLVGMKSGEEKEIEVTFPEDYHSEELKGQKSIFKVKVNEVKQVKIPELDKDFFEDLGMEGIDSKESLEKQVKENLTVRKESEAENTYVDNLLEEAIKTLEVSIPDVMIDEELNRMIDQYGQNLSMQGISLEQFYQFTNSNEQALKDQMKEEAVKRIKIRLMLEEIVKVKDIKVTDKDIDKEVEEMSKKYDMKKDEILKQIGGTEMIKYDLEMHKAIEVLKGE
ncbi:MAG: trigger factor [Clostridium sp.]|nr:trigger factor [Clostridium sp.]MCM1444428.1 trigger factor [Candidatus Amulumruptor caecigallinarius]